MLTRLFQPHNLILITMIKEGELRMLNGGGRGRGEGRRRLEREGNG